MVQYSEMASQKLLWAIDKVLDDDSGFVASLSSSVSMANLSRLVATILCLNQCLVNRLSDDANSQCFLLCFHFYLVLLLSLSCSNYNLSELAEVPLCLLIPLSCPKARHEG